MQKVSSQECGQSSLAAWRCSPENSFRITLALKAHRELPNESKLEFIKTKLGWTWQLRPVMPYIQEEHEAEGPQTQIQSSSRGTRSSVASTHVSWLTTAGTPVWVGGWGRRTLCSLLTSVGTATACWLPGALRATGTCSPGAGRSVLVPTLRTPSLHCHLVLLLAGHSTPPFLHSPGAHPPAMARVWAKEWRGSWSKPGSARRG